VPSLFPTEVKGSSATYPTISRHRRKNLITWISFASDPIPDVWRTTEDSHASCLAFSEEADRLDVNQTYLVEIQADVRSAQFDLCFQFLQVLDLHPADEPNGGAGMVRYFFDFQCHLGRRSLRTPSISATTLPFLSRLFGRVGGILAGRIFGIRRKFGAVLASRFQHTGSATSPVISCRTSSNVTIKLGYL
jgi:hypothetical protein